MSASTLPLDSRTFDQAVADSGVTLVDFWAEWCGPCRALAPTLDRLASDFDGRAKVAKVDVDANPDLASRFGVQSIPTLVFLKDGEEIERVVGNVAYSQLTDTLNRLAG